MTAIAVLVAALRDLERDAEELSPEDLAVFVEHGRPVLDHIDGKGDLDADVLAGHLLAFDAWAVDNIAHVLMLAAAEAERAWPIGSAPSSPPSLAAPAPRGARARHSRSTRRGHGPGGTR